MAERRVFANSVLEADDVQTEAPASSPAVTNPKIDFSKIALAVMPFTPVPFSGQNMIYAIGRVAGYSLLAYLTYNKMRPASYGFMVSAGISLVTSLTAGAWKKHE